jgi:hypothetical protein
LQATRTCAKKGHFRMTISDTTDSGAFTALEVEQANARHDRDYGWSREWASLYTNPFRLPESVLGEPFEEVVEE